MHDYDPDDANLHSHIPCCTPSGHSHIAVPPRCNTDLGRNEFGSLLTGMTQAHSLIICNGRLEGDKGGRCTYRAHPKKGKTGLHPSHTPLSQPRSSLSESQNHLTGESLIDYFIADPELYHTSLVEMKVRMVEPDSDHFPLDLHIRLSQDTGTRPPPPNPAAQRRLKVSPEYFHDFCESLADGQHRELVSLCKSSSTSPDEAAEAVHTYIMQSAENSFPKRSLHSKTQTPKPKPWYDRECKHAKARFLHLFKVRSPEWSQARKDLPNTSQVQAEAQRRRFR